MQRSTEYLNARRRQHLCTTLGGEESFLEIGRQRNDRRQERGEVEGGENGEGVSEGEQGVASFGYGSAHDCCCCCRGRPTADADADGSNRPGRTSKHLRKLGVLVEASAHIDGGGGQEFLWPGRRCYGGLAENGGRDGVDGVCGQVGGAVEGVDEAVRAGEEHGVRAEDECL